MRHIFIIAITAIVAMVGVSCDPKELEVTEKVPPVVEVKPELTLVYSSTVEASEASVYSEVLISDCGDKFLLKVENASDTLTYSLYCADESVVSVVWEDKYSWIVSANAPGVSDIQVIATEADGTEWIYSYEFAAYGHITFESKCDPLERTAGFAIGDLGYENIRAEMYVNIQLTGWSWEDKSDRYTVKLEAQKQTLPLDSGEDYSYLFDLSSAFDEIGERGVHWSAHGLKMDIIVSLNNPFIIIDDIIDDSDREMPEFINFDTEVTFRQEGLAVMNSPESDGWVNQNVDVYL